MLHQVDEDPDALQIGSHRDALIGPVDAGGRFLRLRHEGAAPQAGVSDLLIMVGIVASTVMDGRNTTPG